MPKQYRTREGDITAVDTKTALTTIGPDTAPGALAVPFEMTKLSGAWVAACGNGAATGVATIFVRLEGDGLEKTAQFTAGAMGGSVATGQNAIVRAVYVPLDIMTKGQNEILVFGEMAGVDIGTVSVAVTLVFE